jgi:transposase
MQENLRKQVKIIKALQNITYTEIAEDLEISRSAFYNWLNG